ncbi:hypothetical protein KJY73_02870 [Bowmanella sp. Y26]|uniref:HAAS signaling domain-containing protein n=1 Tax=Bowmanella yangjiangensis TaxID=2811230 RepID=UPI001BDD3F84|nr:hypothetical protein [Bowmanella yangjiangensis]MBT1062496.1 hypothetical protein [Bowmanella yangjiangensis]
MSEHQIIHAYLKSLEKYLARLDKADVDEVIREIESHIYDAIEQQDENGRPAEVQRVLAGFGEPRVLAQRYVEHILNGAPPPAGFKAIQLVKRGATKGLIISMAVFGYSLVIGLLGLCVYKFIEPLSVGVWSTAGGNSFVIGALSQPYPASDELLGWWFIPLALAVSLVIGFLTTRVVSVLANNLSKAERVVR